MATLDMCYIPSSVEGERLHVLVWFPEQPKAVVQIAHGMAEHIARYDEFARFLCDNGYAVIGESHLGHGLSAKKSEGLGYFCKKDGWEHIVKDMALVRVEGEKRFPGLPYLLLGHSMGSFMTRTYITKDYSKGLKGVVISGTGNQPGALVGVGKFLNSIVKLFNGGKHRTQFINSIAFGSYNNDFKPNRTGFDWLSKNEESVDKYVADPFCGYCFTTAAFRDMFTGLKYIGKMSNIEKMDKSLPCLFIAGAKDPVGACGKGVKETAEMFKQAGAEKIDVKIYEDDRHEVLNELDRQKVYDDVLKFFDDCLEIKAE